MYLITGGAGFIGSHLVTRLVQQGKRVRVLDNFSTGCLRKLDPVRDMIELVDGDVRDTTAVAAAVQGIEVVLHHAAQISVPHSVEDPRTTIEVNVTGTLNVLEAAREAGCRRVVLASSCAVYGDSPRSPLVESVPPSPTSPYAISKLTGEQLCATFTRLHGLETVALRYFNVFGPGQDANGGYAAVVPRFLEALDTGAPLVVYGDGEQTRDFVHVSNIVYANLLAATRPAIGGRVFNIASGHSVSLNDMIEILERATGRPIPRRYEPARPGDVRHSRADITVAQEELGYRAHVWFEDGLREMLVRKDAPLALDASYSTWTALHSPALSVRREREVTGALGA